MCRSSTDYLPGLSCAYYTSVGETAQDAPTPTLATPRVVAQDVFFLVSRRLAAVWCYHLCGLTTYVIATVPRLAILMALVRGVHSTRKSRVMAVAGTLDAQSLHSSSTFVSVY